ncbi:MAG: tetratricopeptide repeat protein, partial [Thermoanaerobaculia bacterium]|nr:tetratricopeptide repeat protein [Thermoanaerobaculia bacterium]
MKKTIRYIISGAFLLICLSVQSQVNDIRYYRHRADSLIGVLERPDLPRDTAYWAMLLDSLSWTIYNLETAICSREQVHGYWDGWPQHFDSLNAKKLVQIASVIVPYEDKQDELNAKKLGFLHPLYYQYAIWQGTIYFESRWQKLPQRITQVADAFIQTVERLKAESDSARIVSLIDSLWSFTGFIRNHYGGTIYDTLSGPVMLKTKALTEKKLGKTPLAYRSILFETINLSDADLARAEAVLTKSLWQYKSAGLENTWLPYKKSACALIALYKKAGRYSDWATVLDDLYEATKIYNPQGLMAQDMVGIEDFTDWQDFASNFHQLGRMFAQKVYNYEKSIEYYEKSLEVTNRYGGNQPVAESYKNSSEFQLAWAYHSMDRIDLADPIFEKNLNNGNRLSEVADYYLATQRPRKAEICLLKSLKKSQPASAQFLWQLKRLAWVYKTDAQFEKADSVLIEIISNIEKQHKTESRIYCMALRDLGLVRSNQGNFREAETYLLQAAESLKKKLEGKSITPRQFGSGWEEGNHPDYAECLNSLGIFYNTLGQFQKAEQCYFTALDIHREIHRQGTFSQDRDIALLLNNLGVTY